ncbi:DUF1127 domain-containing protein [Yoonia sediminilitoris]|uniref:Uncharacterized protein YjiS (DUF1127 family) n=1 Tax=Yoonia sediminilitoris TaxID=1286148 RepID=A0A2T6KQ19_9RHOB|nr:DUF1127 domain-containing protein [Yoonia sediminilitoris]PUB18648.1 uncharacterized protein YjiS (DUF1127 family) [Yoonia sediminilitoris]RCW98816.1 uncharacterized protein YjiS (DUF1127 family) [Yoonia sediminilitoris]
MTSLTAQTTCPHFEMAKPRGLSQTLTSWIALARQRRALAMLDDHLLRDIGVTRADALQEARKPVWEHPANAGK